MNIIMSFIVYHCILLLYSMQCLTRLGIRWCGCAGLDPCRN